MSFFIKNAKIYINPNYHSLRQKLQSSDRYAGVAGLWLVCVVAVNNSGLIITPKVYKRNRRDEGETVNSLYSSLIINISLLVLIATLLTKLTFVKRLLSEESSSKIADQLILALIFGGFCIFSTCTGVKIGGAIQNTRVLGVLAAGLLGGPVVGIGAAFIGALHRFLYDPFGFTSLACTVSTLFEGVFGSIVWVIFKKHGRKQNKLSLFFITAIAECFQMIFILLIAKPFSAAVNLVQIIAIPMIVVNSLGMILFFSIFEDVFTNQDLLAAKKIRLALTIADECIPYIQKSSKTREDYSKMATIIQKYSNCNGVLFLTTDGAEVLNDTNLAMPKTVFDELKKKEMPYGFYRITDKKDKNYKYLKRYTIFMVPLTQGENAWAYLAIYFPKQIVSIQAEMDFITGLAKFFSTNYELAQVEKQKKLRQRAEYQALQSQINPHFLFNSLNTISFFCREKPERARELLLALSVYFRNTLEATDAYMIPLEKELEHVKAYLQLELARFENKLTVEIKVDTSAAIQVPTLILQPIVENAVKHGAMKRETGKVTILGENKGEYYSIIVKDNGLGMSSESLTAFYRHKKNGKYGLQNVDARMKSIYGAEHGLKIKTGEQGTEVTMNFFKVTTKGEENENSNRR